MNFKQLVKKIKQDTWWSEEAPTNYQYSFSAWRAFVRQARIHGPNYLSILFALFKNDFMFEKTSEQEKLSQFWKVYKRFLKEKRDLSYYLDFLKARDDLRRTHKLIDESLSKPVSADELAGLYQRLYDDYTEMFTHSTMPEGADIYSNYYLLGDLKRYTKKQAGNEELNEIAIVMSAPHILSFMERERTEFLRNALSKKPDWKKMEVEYHWVQNNYLGPKHLSAGYFRKEAQKILRVKGRTVVKNELKNLNSKIARIRKRQSEYVRKFGISREMQNRLAYMRLLARWIDERKEVTVMTIGYLGKLLKLISRRYSVPQQWLGYYLPEEVFALIKERKKISPKVLKERRALSVYITTVSAKKPYYKQKLLTGSQARKIYELLTKHSSEEIKGFPASAPVERQQGMVQVVLNPHKESFKSGRVLVTSMTRPDFVPLMRRASAIITDEGGLTCHAAIVSRELGIPCIIGTKNATKVLRSGQKVVMDLKSGKIEVVE